MCPKRLSVFLAFGLGLAATGMTAQEHKTEMTKGWGQVIDPDEDCTIKVNNDKLLITVPGDCHIIHPGIAANAPRVLRDVDGDFMIQVRVSGKFKPSDQATMLGGFPFNGAGLLVWENKKNYLRLERNAWRVPARNLSVCHPPLLEYFKNGEYQNTDPPIELDSFFKGDSSYLRLERLGDKIIASFSHDGEEWSVVREIDTSFSKKVKVGLAASNTSDKPFKVEFDKLRFTTK
jgi:Protein of unknown function (DUF1349)